MLSNKYGIGQNEDETKSLQLADLQKKSNCHQVTPAKKRMGDTGFEPVTR